MQNHMMWLRLSIALLMQIHSNNLSRNMVKLLFVVMREWMDGPLALLPTNV